MIGAAGYQLSLYGDVISHRAGLSSGWIGMSLLATPGVFMLYLVAMRTVFSYERSHKVADPLVTDETLPSLHQAMWRFAATMVVLLAASWLPFVVLELAAVMGWTRTFVGSMFVALVTILPELALTLSALLGVYLLDTYVLYLYGN